MTLKRTELDKKIKKINTELLLHCICHEIITANVIFSFPLRTFPPFLSLCLSWPFVCYLENKLALQADMLHATCCSLIRFTLTRLPLLEVRPSLSFDTGLCE